MKYLPYVNYFRQTAIKLKAISHSEENMKFCRMDIEEVLTNLKTKLDLSTPCLILEAYQMHVDDHLSDNLRDIKTGAFMIVQHIDGDFNDQDIVLGETESITLKVWAKMKKEKSLNTAIKHIDLGSLRMNKVGPLWGKCYGWRTEFRIDESLNHNVVYNPEDYHS